MSIIILASLLPIGPMMNAVHFQIKVFWLTTTAILLQRIPLAAQPVADTLFENSADSVFIVSDVVKESVNSDEIHTVQLQQAGLELGYPMILLGSDDQLELAFDDFGSTLSNYSYTVVHCNQDWTPSGLNYFDYQDGFEENYIEDYSFSFATLQKYTHYSLFFPNDDLRFRISGNYAIYIWRDEDKTTPVIVRRFLVREEWASVTGQVMRPNLISYRNEFQEINFTVDIRNVQVSNPYDEIRVTLMQNGRFDNAYYHLKPRLVNNSYLTFDQDDIVFPAGKEFRHFDLKTLSFQSDRIRKISSENKEYNAWVTVDESRSYSQYHYEKDINGQFIIMADNANNPSLEGDYAWVHFTLQYPYFITSGKFYVFGQLTNYTLSPLSEMQYDFDAQEYRATLYLKQGYYNYVYAFQPEGEGEQTDFSFAEGNYFESENDYLILVYLHSYDRDYDRLIGIATLNSIKP